MSKAITKYNHIEQLVYFIRGDKVMLDSDLAIIYGIETKALNKAVKRNLSRFPEDFMFQLTLKEWDNLRFQIGTTSGVPNKINPQVETAGIHGGRRYTPYVFTEHGAVMLASVLNSPQAIEASVQVVRAFVQLREILATHKQLAEKLEKLEAKYDKTFKEVFSAIRFLMTSQAHVITTKKGVK